MSARILVADDDDMVRGLMRVILGGAGYLIEEAVDGAEAVRKCLAGRYDLLLMDHNMPQMSGWEACAEIKRQNPAMKVLILSGGVHEPPSSGAGVRFLSKPFDNRQLVTVVGELLRG
ncbi:MAG: response regulator [Verrucomicrobia subdivision 3 bacterium]|nr:response regulator [Limisphaerales bacterium]